MYKKELGRKGTTLALLWEEYRKVHPNGYSYSYFANLYKEWRSASSAWMPQEHKAGECMFVDYAGMTIPIYDSQASAVSFEAQIFVSCLGSSSYIYCKAYRSQQLHEWIDAHKSMFTFYEGVPQFTCP